jgi:putative spermidine/putrescine transport system permease protein
MQGALTRKDEAPGLADRIDRRTLLVIPALAISLVLFVYPVGMVLLHSLTDPTLGLHNYRAVATEPVYAGTMWNTVVISASVTAICAVIGYPFAHSIASAGPRLRGWLIFAVLVPFWSSVLVRCFAWLVLLQRQGMINKALMGLGLTDAPMLLVHNRIGVLIGMSHVLLPFMVLPLYSVMRRIDASYMKAAASLGAPSLQRFWRIYLPLTSPGLLNGAMLVFVLGLGYFVVPALLGGAGETMLAQLIQSQISDFGDWGLGGALSVVLLVVVATIFFVVRRSVPAPTRLR